MIRYESRGTKPFWNLFKMSGSIFPQATLIAFPCGVITLAVRLLFEHAGIETQTDVFGVINNSVWSGFTMFVGFFIVFRTSIAYQRFWQGCCSLHKMRSSWFEACSAIVSFCNVSNADTKKVNSFKYRAVLLFDLIHAVALAEVEDSSSKNSGSSKAKDASFPEAYKFPLIDAAGLEDEAMQTLQSSPCKVEMVFGWIQTMIAEGVKEKVLDVAPPIVTRAFQELSAGMSSFNEMSIVAVIPFPFPYSQTCDFLLFLHFVTAPMATAYWVEKPWFAGFFAFLQVFVLWGLKFIALELEMPFGNDANDIDLADAQYQMNEHLLMLLEQTKCPNVSITREQIVASALARHSHTSEASTQDGAASADTEGPALAPTGSATASIHSQDTDLNLLDVWTRLLGEQPLKGDIVRSCRGCKREHVNALHVLGNIKKSGAAQRAWAKARSTTRAIEDSVLKHVPGHHHEHHDHPPKGAGRMVQSAGLQGTTQGSPESRADGAESAGLSPQERDAQSVLV